MEAAGALGAAAPILESISNPFGGAGWSWVGCGCQKCPILDQIPTCLVPCIGGIKQRALNTWRGRLQHYLQLLNSKINQKMIVI